MRYLNIYFTFIRVKIIYVIIQKISIIYIYHSWNKLIVTHNLFLSLFLLFNYDFCIDNDYFYKKNPNFYRIRKHCIT